ncbi:MAG: HEAT repeat domain-containing protein [Vicinamibacterales bacterium]
MAADTAQPLGPQEVARLTDFARACKAAARAVVLYPEGHPAVASTLGRIVQVTSIEAIPVPMRIEVMADGLRIEGRAASKPDSSLGELAALLHSHSIGGLTVQGGGDAAAWRSFLILIGRSAETVRAEGGIGKLWAAAGSSHIELNEIDYSEVLRERAGRLPAGWDDVVANCLQGRAPVFDEQQIRTLLEMARSNGRIAEMITAFEARLAEETGAAGPRAAALLLLLKSIIDSVRAHDPASLQAVMSELSQGVAQLTPEVVLALTGARESSDGETAALVSEIVENMSEPAIAGFVARNALSTETATDRLAQAFHALVRDAEDRERMVALAHDEASRSPLGTLENFERDWGEVAQRLLTSYTDEPFVSQDYARELSGTRTRALSVEQVSDDPPTRVEAWLGTVSTNEIRRLDVTLMIDLLRVETAQGRLALAPPVVALLDDLLLLGDFESAVAILRVVQDGSAGSDVATAKEIAKRLSNNQTVAHIVAHLATIDEAQLEQMKAFCVGVGDGLIKPMAEALASEERARPRERLTSLFIAFGPAGRREIERLKAATNPGARKTAVTLLRRFGGKEALSELADLLGDSEPQVQREAVRAILDIGSDQACELLARALTKGTERSRDAIMQALTGARGERAAALFSYILAHVDPRGPLHAVHVRAIEALGMLRDPDGVEPLRAALYRREWWAPRRTASLRAAAATALVRIGSPEAVTVLEEASQSGPRGVRSAINRARSQAS